MLVFTPHGWLEKLLAALQRKALQALIKPVFSPRFSVSFQRRWLDVLARLSVPVPRAARVTAATVGGVPGEWLRAKATTAEAAPATILYLHGGAYCIGSPRTHRSLTARLGLASGLPVFAADYRLAPEHPFPAALDDALAAYRALRADGPVIVGGDSAGGGLALALAMALRDAGEALPASLLLLSPLGDAVQPDLLPAPPPGEAMLSAAWAESCLSAYRGQRSAAEHGISPLRGNLRGLPPTLIQAGTDELLHGQALALETALQAAGVHTRCEITQHRWHVFQLHGGVLKSADEAITRLASFAQSHLPRTQADGVDEHDIVILGAGMSGLCMAIQLQKAGLHNFVMLEKQPGLGGTWWDNTYPGAHVDVPSPVYSFSFAPNPRWTRRFAGAPEIQAYMQQLAERHGLTERIRFNTRLAEATFDEASGQWQFKTENGARLRSRFFVCSTGPLNQPRWPDIPGLADFQGQRLHSARWDHSVPLAGQRVAVIGTGSTASQLIPPVSAQAKQLHVFQRTANWVLPRIDRPYFAIDRALAQSALYNRAVRWCWMQLLEWGRRGFNDGTLARKGMLKTAAVHRQRQVSDPALRAQLTPNYPLGCKRLIYSNDFYPALVQPHVELVTTGIARFTETGIVTSDGVERAIDVLVCATGFDTQHLLASLQVTGRAGQTLAQAWAVGPEAYHGISVAGFPNLFLMLGPNTATGHTSTLLYIEPEVQHAIACMQAVRAGGRQSIEVKADAMADHNRDLQARLDGSVWSQCSSWYRMDSGKIVALFPGFTAEYVKAVRQPDFGCYRFD